MFEENILFVCPKTGEWPPRAWGAVEIVCYELSKALNSLGVNSIVFPTNHLEDLVKYIENNKKQTPFTFIHLEYDDHHKWYLALRLLYPTLRIGATSHFAYLTQLDKQPFYRNTTFLQTLECIQKGLEYYPLTSAIQNLFSNSYLPIPNGASTEIRFTDNPTFRKRAICLGKVESRKGQYRLQTIPRIDFVGPNSSNSLLLKNYKGEWTRKEVYNNLTEYDVLILLSEAEAAPLVVLEGLMAGCGIVCTEICKGNLPELSWVRYVDLQCSPQTIEEAIDKVCSFTQEERRKRREWAEKNISWLNIAKVYKKKIFSA